MFMILLTANFKFRNRSTCSKEPIKRTGKVCGDSQDLKSAGSEHPVKFGLDIFGELKHLATEVDENILKLSSYVKTGCNGIYDTKSSANFLCGKMH